MYPKYLDTLLTPYHTHYAYRIQPNNCTVRLGFSKLLGTLSCVKTWIHLLRVHYKKDQKRIFDDDYAIFFPDFLHEGIYCGYSFELHWLVDAILMSTHKICLYNEVGKRYTGCNLKTTKLLIGVCAVIRSNTVCVISGRKIFAICAWFPALSHLTTVVCRWNANITRLSLDGTKQGFIKSVLYPEEACSEKISCQGPRNRVRWCLWRSHLMMIL